MDIKEKHRQGYLLFINLSGLCSYASCKGSWSTTERLWVKASFCPKVVASDQFKSNQHLSASTNSSDRKQSLSNVETLLLGHWVASLAVFLVCLTLYFAKAPQTISRNYYFIVAGIELLFFFYQIGINLQKLIVVLLSSRIQNSNAPLLIYTYRPTVT